MTDDDGGRWEIERDPDGIIAGQDLGVPTEMAITLLHDHDTQVPVQFVNFSVTAKRPDGRVQRRQYAITPEKAGDIAGGLTAAMGMLSLRAGDPDILNAFTAAAEAAIEQAATEHGGEHEPDDQPDR